MSKQLTQTHTPGYDSSSRQRGRERNQESGDPVTGFLSEVVVTHPHKRTKPDMSPTLNDYNNASLVGHTLLPSIILANFITIICIS